MIQTKALTHQQLRLGHLLFSFDTTRPITPQAVRCPLWRQRLTPPLAAAHAVDGKGERWLRPERIEGLRIVASDPILHLEGHESGLGLQ